MTGVGPKALKVGWGNWEGWLFGFFGSEAEVCGYEIVYFAVEDGLGVGGLVIGAVVLDHLVGLEDVGADLVAPGDFALFAVDFGEFVVTFLLFESFDFCF